MRKLCAESTTYGTLRCGLLPKRLFRHLVLSLDNAWLRPLRPWVFALTRVCFFCERCESILQPGHNCTVRIEKNKPNKRYRHKKSNIAIQNNVVYNCHFCSHRNLMRGLRKGYIKEISPQKAKRPSRLDPANHVVETSTSLSKTTTVDGANKKDAVTFPITDGQNLEPISPSTPLLATCLSLLDAKRRKPKK